jgi:hypothetical protein
MWHGGGLDYLNRWSALQIPLLEAVYWPTYLVVSTTASDTGGGLDYLPEVVSTTVPDTGGRLDYSPR